MPQRTRIKICGLRTEADVDAAVDAGADAVGFVLYDKSPRHVDAARAGELARRLPAFVTPVLLFVNAGYDAIEAALSAVPHALLQFHGDEPPAFCESVRRPYLRAVPMKRGVDLLDWSQRFKGAAGLLLDAPVEGYGGGGKVFEWSLVTMPPRSLRSLPPEGVGPPSERPGGGPMPPTNVRIPLVLSGGLNAANVIDGVMRLRPHAVDVSSGVEQSRGVKSPDLIRRFCEAVREADARVADAGS
jgi:phosphoribosylanthranilate isomerase